MPEWLKYVLAFVVGGAGSFFAPWANWGIEKRKIRLQQRIAIIKTFKKSLDDYGSGAVTHDPVRYAQLKPYLDKRLVAEIGKIDDETDGEDRKAIAHKLIDEVAKLERKWGIF